MYSIKNRLFYVEQKRGILFEGWELNDIWLIQRD